MKKRIKIISITGIVFLIIFSLLALNFGLANNIENIITKKTGYQYEVGIKIVKNWQIVENKFFIDIPIGIAVFTSNNLIINCTFINCADEGIVIFGNNNIIKNCVFYKCLDGVELQSSSNNKFINCQFLSCSHAGIDGILENNNNNIFSFCIFYNNLIGCYFSNSVDNKFNNCSFIDNEINYSS